MVVGCNWNESEYDGQRGRENKQKFDEGGGEKEEEEEREEEEEEEEEEGMNFWSKVVTWLVVVVVPNQLVCTNNQPLLKGLWDY